MNEEKFLFLSEPIDNGENRYYYRIDNNTIRFLKKKKCFFYESQYHDFNEIVMFLPYPYSHLSISLDSNMKFIGCLMFVSDQFPVRNSLTTIINECYSVTGDKIKDVFLKLLREAKKGVLKYTKMAIATI